MASRGVLLFSIIFLCFLIAPYLLAAGSPGDVVFGGLLLNPLDGHSYFAKMRLGWDGEWMFRLPFTAEPGEGAYMFLFYIFLGHVAQWFSIPIVVMFHAARLASSAFLLFSLWKFIGNIYREENRFIRTKVFVWLVIGTGAGWLVFPFGLTTSDLWVAEAFPFISMYSNPHFPLGIALLLWSLMAYKYEIRAKWLILISCGLGLSVIMPFGLVVAGVVLGADVLWIGFSKKQLKVKELAMLMLLGGPFLLYQYLVTLSNPSLANWNSQNLTPSPPVWDFLISFSPAIFFAGLSGWRYLRSPKEETPCRLLVIWLVVGGLLIYLPFGLQRRFMFAYSIPVFILAGLEVQLLAKKIRKKWLWTAIIGCSTISAVLVVVLGFFGVQSLAPSFFISADEYQAFKWLESNGNRGEVVLCAPETGMFIPEYTGLRVVYGHPFETINAENEKRFVINYFERSGRIEDDEPLVARGVDYLFFGPREFAFSGTRNFPKNCDVVFDSASVVICKYPAVEP